MKKAFTLIELIVVISIITITASSWVFYFLDFVKSNEIKSKLSLLETEIENIDNKVDNYEIFDYKLIFSTTNTWYYINYSNFFDSNIQTISDLTSSWTWTITTNPASWTWVIKIFRWNKLFLAKEIDRTIPFNFNFWNYEYYKISWTLENNLLNDIEIKYFSPDNLRTELNNNLELVWINTKEDKTWTNYNKIIIENISWKKKFLDYLNNEINLDKIFLFFDNNWKEAFLEIKK